MPDAGPGGGFDRGAVLAGAAAERVGADQEHPVAASERGAEARGVVEVAVADGRAAVLAQGVRPAGDEHELVGLEPLEQPLGDEAAEVAGGSCDDHAHPVRSTLGGAAAGLPEPKRRP